MSDMPRTIRVELGERSYDIAIGTGLLSNAAAYIKPLVKSNDVFIAWDENVASPHGKMLFAALSQAGLNVQTMQLPAGETAKSVEHLNALWDRLSELHFGRDCTVVALGGGVIGDLAGFAAASYLRGVRLVQVPTSLLAMVDSSVGGKTGINNRFGKNLLGAFWQPSLVLADMDTLQTLPREECISALAEIVKYGVIYDGDFFGWLEENLERVRDLSTDEIALAVQRSCEIKAEVVRQDERESGLREILNFGHTAGHAIENAAGYGTIRHGEAISIGMVAESLMAQELTESWSVTEHERLVSLLRRAGLPVELAASLRLSMNSVMQAAQSDKKNRQGNIRCVLPISIGRVESRRIDTASLATALHQVGVPNDQAGDRR